MKKIDDMTKNMIKDKVEELKGEVVELREEVVELKDEVAEIDTDGVIVENGDTVADLDDMDSEEDIDDTEELDESVDEAQVLDLDEPVDNSKETKKSKKRKDKSKKKENIVKSIVKCLVICVIIIALVAVGFVVGSQHLFALVMMDGDCMQPNINNGDTVMVSRIVKAKDIERYDVILFKNKTDGNICMRRVMGLPGEKVEMKNGYVYINGKKIEDPYRGKNSRFGIMGEESIKLKKDEFFVLCDYRPNIDDSRMKEIGPVSAKEIVGVRRAE